MGTYKILMGTYKIMMGTYKFMMGTYKFMMGTYKMQVMHKFVLVLIYFSLFYDCIHSTPTSGVFYDLKNVKIRILGTYLRFGIVGTYQQKNRNSSPQAPPSFQR
jgi:hypothetical protein